MSRNETEDVVSVVSFISSFCGMLMDSS